MNTISEVQDQLLKIDQILLQKASKVQEDSFGNQYVDGVLVEAIKIDPAKQSHPIDQNHNMKKYQTRSSSKSQEVLNRRHIKNIKKPPDYYRQKTINIVIKSNENSEKDHVYDTSSNNSWYQKFKRQYRESEIEDAEDNDQAVPYEAEPDKHVYFQTPMGKQRRTKKDRRSPE